MRAKILLVYVEPATYVVDLIDELFGSRMFDFDIVYLSRASTQNWDVSFRGRVVEGSTWKQFASLRQLIIKREYDLIHLAGWGHPVLMLMILFSWLIKKYCTVETDTPLLDKRAGLKSVLKSIFYPLLFKIPKLFFPGGTPQAAYLKHYSVADSKVVKANMTVDVERLQGFKRRHKAKDRNRTRYKLGISEEDFVFLYVGRLEPQKGLHDLVAAHNEISNASLVLVGDGSLREELSQSPELVSVGRLKDESLFNAFCAADILVLPSRFEPWGLVINEAMALKVPVLISSVVGCREDLVIENQTGLVFEAGNVPDLVEKMSFAITEKEQLNQFADSASDLISTWTLQATSNKMESAWERLLTS